ncbi:hypothetical protein AAG906_036864 [Vitis piasezkii]
MCRGDDLFAWKHLISSEVCRGLRTSECLDHLIAIPSSHVGAYESLQSCLSHHLGPMFSLLPSRSGHLYDFKVLIIHPDFGLPPQDHFRSWLSMESHSWRRVKGRLIRSDSYQSSDSLVEMSDKLASTIASIQEASLSIPFHLADHYEVIPPPTVIVPPPIDEGLTWDDRDGIPTASLPAKFLMPDIKHYSGIGCPKIHLRLYNTVMRAHKIYDAQLVALFPMSLNGAAQRCSLSALTLMYPDESWRPPDRGHMMVGMIDRPKEQDQIDMVLQNLQPRFARCLLGIPVQDLKSLVHTAFSVEVAIARGLWADIAHSLDSKGNKSIGSSSRSGEQPYITQTNMQPRPPHLRATTPPPPRPYAQRPMRQFTPLGMTWTRAFEKLRDAGLIVPLVPHPLSHPIPPHFCLHEHCLCH